MSSTGVLEAITLHSKSVQRVLLSCGILIASARTIFDKMFAKKEQADTVPQIRLVTLWFGEPSHRNS